MNDKGFGNEVFTGLVDHYDAALIEHSLNGGMVIVDSVVK